MKHHTHTTADGRKLSTHAAPGSVPVTVTTEVPLTIITGAGGAREVIETDTAEPCYGCACCALWAGTVDTLRAALVTHEYDDHAAGAVPAEWHPGCLVCQLLAGVADD